MFMKNGLFSAKLHNHVLKRQIERKKACGIFKMDAYMTKVFILVWPLSVSMPLSEWQSVLLLCLCRSMLSWWVTLPSPMTTSLQRLSPTLQASTASPWSGSPPACPSTQTRWVTDERDVKSNRASEENRKSVSRERGSKELPRGDFRSFLD